MNPPDAQAWLDALDSEATVHRPSFDGGGQVTWRRFGEGPPVVLLHGGHGRWTHWARNIRAWSSRFSLWVPDLPGYGDSDMPPGPSIQALVDATRQTLDHLVPHDMPLRLVGFSFGSLVAANLAVHRGSVSHLALLGPAGHGGPRRSRGPMRAWRDLEPGGADWQDAMRHNLAMHMLWSDASMDPLAVQIHARACAQTRFHSKTLSRASTMPDILAQYAGQLLLAWGEHDVTAQPAQAGALLSQGRRDCSLHIVPGGGHWLQYERADAVNPLVLSWLGDARTPQ